jgi:hypothetical protein
MPSSGSQTLACVGTKRWHNEGYKEKCAHLGGSERIFDILLRLINNLWGRFFFQRQSGRYFLEAFCVALRHQGGLRRNRLLTVYTITYLTILVCKYNVNISLRCWDVKSKA